MIQAVTSRCDEQSMGAYVESRHGFELIETLAYRNAPPSWLMWRDPRLSG